MSDASAGTLTDQVAGSASADVAGRSVPPTVTVTLTPPTAPVSPEILNPNFFSAALMTLSVAMGSTRVSTSVPVACTVTG